jgi:hypothetical protein
VTDQEFLERLAQGDIDVRRLRSIIIRYETDARRGEDIVFSSQRTILRLLNEIDQLVEELERRPAKKWEDANRRRAAIARGKATQARALRGQGQTIAQIAAALHRCRKTVEGYLSDME